MAWPNSQRRRLPLQGSRVQIPLPPLLFRKMKRNTRSVKMEDEEAEMKAFVSGEATKKEKKVRFEGD